MFSVCLLTGGGPYSSVRSGARSGGGSPRPRSGGGGVGGPPSPRFGGLTYGSPPPKKKKFGNVWDFFFFQFFFQFFFLFLPQMADHPEAHSQEADPEGVGLGNTPLAVMQ